MDTAQIEINDLLKKAGLGKADEMRHLGQGGLNNSYYARVGADEYCVRMAKYDLKTGLAREADALSRLPEGIGPRLIYFSKDSTDTDRLWIIETYLEGRSPKELSLRQLKSLGAKLAKVHAIPAPTTDAIDEGEVTVRKTDLFQYLLWHCRYMFTPEQITASLPDSRVQRIVHKAKDWFADQQKTLNLPEKQFLQHNDISPSNLLVQRDEVFLVDWELRGFGDPMQDFPTGFWDFELNEGKWRTTLSPEQWIALFEGYRAGGGEIDEGRIKLWTIFNKIVIAIYLTFLIHCQRHDTTSELQAQHLMDLDNVVRSLNRILL